MTRNILLLRDTRRTMVDSASQLDQLYELQTLNDDDDTCHVYTEAINRDMDALAWHDKCVTNRKMIDSMVAHTFQPSDRSVMGSLIFRLVYAPFFFDEAAARNVLGETRWCQMQKILHMMRSWRNKSTENRELGGDADWQLWMESL